MPTQNQPWLRAELIAAPETTPGAQLMIPADGVEFHDDQLVFHHQGDIVYVAPQSQLRSITWFAKQPNPETARRKAQWPKHGTRWTDEERADLLRHLHAGHSWKAISHAHGRSRTGCQQEAVKQGWLNPETLQPTAELLLAAARETTLAEPTTGPLFEARPTSADDAARDPAATPDPQPVADQTSPPAGSSDSEPDATLTAFADALRKAVPADDSADPPQGAFLVPARPIPSATSSPTFIASAPEAPASQPSQTIGPDPAASPLRPPSAEPPAPKAPSPEPAPPGSPSPESQSPESPSLKSPSPNSPPPGSLAPESPSPEPALPGSPSPRSLPPVSPSPESLSATPLAPDPLASATAAPPPDRPRIPPRVPRQRTTPAAEVLPPGGGDPDKDSDPDSGSGSMPGSGSRFLSRAQSSLARATLGAYMNPPRGQSGAPSGAT